MARRGYQYIRVCPVTLSACCAGSVQFAATPQLRSVAEILGRGDEIAGGVHQLGAAGAHDMDFGQVCGGRGFGAGLGLGLPHHVPRFDAQSLGARRNIPVVIRFAAQPTSSFSSKELVSIQDSVLAITGRWVPHSRR